MVTLDNQNRPIIACGSSGTVYVCSDLKQVKNGSLWDIKKKSDNTLIDTIAMKHPDLDEEII